MSSEDYIKRGKLASNFLLRVVFTFSGLASTFSVYHHILDDISNEYGNEKNTFWHEKNAYFLIVLEMILKLKTLNTKYTQKE